jgi:vesicle-fusing ATPase
MTVLEVTHSQTEVDISTLVKKMESKIPEITDYTYNHRARLIKPMLSYDAAAIALTFLPAAGGDGSDGRDPNADGYTYHHLRRDIYALSKSTGIEIESRYVVPSSHLTIARFVSRKDFTNADTGALDKQKIEDVVGKLVSINHDLQAEDESAQTETWQVGEGKGLVCRTGTVWYGGGQSQHEGRGF